MHLTPAGSESRPSPTATQRRRHLRRRLIKRRVHGNPSAFGRRVVRPRRGILLETNRQVDVTTGSIEVVCAFPNPDHILRPGEFGRVRAAPDTSRGALLVPQKAVIELQGTYSLAVVGGDNKVVLRPITVGEQVDSMWIVDSGVRSGERVVVEGLQKVHEPGSPVTIKPSTPATSGD